MAARSLRRGGSNAAISNSRRAFHRFRRDPLEGLPAAPADSDGKVWEITLAPPSRTSSAGLKQDTIPVGAMVTVHGQRNRNPSRYEMKTIQVEYAGRQYNVYPEFTNKVR